jgi:hypothetical protein
MTPQQPPSDSIERDKRLARARALLDAYGADRSRWPEDARSLFDKFAGDYRFEMSRDEAQALDETLAKSAAPAAGDALQEAVLASFTPEMRTSVAKGGGFRFGRLIPAGALAGLTALGFIAGSASAGVSLGGSEDEALYYAEATLSLASEEDALWAQE